jgi:lysozyme
MKISPKGLAVIKQFEGLRLTAYKCPAGVLTIGYGSTGAHVKPGMIITEQEAERLLLGDISRFEVGVQEVIKKTLTQGQFDALVSFSFNVGLGALRESTLAAKLKAGDVVGAANEFARWNKAGGKVLPGLVKRREAERALFVDA